MNTMKELSIVKMTRVLCHQYYREFQLDPDLFVDKQNYRPYVYDRDQCDAYYDRYVRLGREHLAIMLDDVVIGELVLKNIEKDRHHCTMGISLKNDSFKNKGYGTTAEILALNYAFSVMGMDTVYADALLGNNRSRHVLQKAGFLETHRDDMFSYYRCDYSTWKRPNVV